MKLLTTFLCSALLAGPALIQSQAQSGGPPAKIDVSQFPATMVEDVVVPVPSEIFAVLDKLGSPNWHAQLGEETVETKGTRPQIALLLGCVVAEGFIAVQAQDTAKVKEIGKDVLKLSEAIGVRDAVIEHCNSIIEGADKRQWNRVRSELDRAQQNVRQAMVELRDEELAQLVSLGGWLRGTEVLTAIVGSDYSKDGADLLHQPKLVEYFENQLGNMGPRIMSDETVRMIQADLKKIQPLVVVDVISLESVKKIHDMTKSVVDRIMKR